MELYIDESKHNPGALLYDPRTNQALYRITNSHKHTLVTRPNPIGAAQEEKVAEIEWSTLGTTQLTSSIVGSSRLIPVGNIIEKKRMGRHYAFSGPDRRKYRWKVKTNGCKLITDGDAETLIAEYTEKKRHLLHSTEPAKLMVMPSGTYMLDMVVMTFAYVERQRKKGRETAEGLGALGDVIGAIAGS